MRKPKAKKGGAGNEIPVQQLAPILNSLTAAQNIKDNQKTIQIEKDKLKIEADTLALEKNKIVLDIVGNFLSNTGSTLAKGASGSWAVFQQSIITLFGDGHLSGWVVLILAILVITGLYVMFFNFNQSPYAPRFKIMIFNNIFNYVAKIFLYITPSYKFRIFTKSITPYTGVDPTTVRPTIIGRCDNLIMREISSKTGAGLCVNTMQPDPIKWIISPESMPELQDLDPIIRSKIEGVDGEKSIVNIPWKVYGQDGMNYYPDCSKAIFSDGKSASYLFQDNGINSCNRKVLSRKTYTSKNRPINIGGTDSENKYKGLDNYV